MVYINRNAQINGIESFRTLLILLSIFATFFVKTNIDGGIWRLVSESAFPSLSGDSTDISRYGVGVPGKVR